MTTALDKEIARVQDAECKDQAQLAVIGVESCLAFSTAIALAQAQYDKLNGKSPGQDGHEPADPLALLMIASNLVVAAELRRLRWKS